MPDTKLTYWENWTIVDNNPHAFLTRGYSRHNTVM